MRFIEQELYAGIKARLLDPANATHYTDHGLTAPVTIRPYNGELDEEENSMPMNRPAVLVDFGKYEYNSGGGHQSAPVPVILYVFQDFFTPKTGNVIETDDVKYQTALKYVPLVEELLHNYPIDGRNIEVTSVEKRNRTKNQLIHEIGIIARVSVVRRTIQ